MSQQHPLLRWPRGKIVVVSSFDFAPKGSPFSGLFSLLIDDTAVTGIWTVDARIDGQTAGSYSFEIVSAGSAVPSRQPAPYIPATPAEIYRLAQAATVFVDKFDAAGKQIGHGSGFIADSLGLVTTFENIDGASSLRIILPNGQTRTTDEILAWNRWQDWVILKTDTAGLPALKSSAQKPWAVGDTCFWLGTAIAGGRAMVNGGIVGDTAQPRVGHRISLSQNSDSASIGSPVLNEFGEAIGILAHDPLPGVRDPDLSAPGGAPPPGSRVLDTGLAVPIDLVKPPTAGQSASRLAELATKGLFVPSLQARDWIAFAALALTMESKRQDVPAWPRGTRTQFSLSDHQMTVFVNWQPKTKFKGLVTVRFFDLDNRELGQSPPLKISLQPGNFTSTSWPVPLATFSPGIYRVDVYLGDAPAWREFFRVVP
jgi:S1-C subfamily serine protease